MRLRQRINTPLYVAIGGLADLGGTLRFKRDIHVHTSRQQDIDNINADGRKVLANAGLMPNTGNDVSPDNS